MKMAVFWVVAPYSEDSHLHTRRRKQSSSYSSP
jgi:hypothetical protein